MNWIDLHADTPLRLYRNHGSLEKNNFHLDVMRSTPFARFLQCAALYCPADVTDAKGFSFVLSMSDYFEGEIGKCREATLIRSAADFRAAWEAGKRAFLLTLEDARILDGKTERIALLYSRGAPRRRSRHLPISPSARCVARLAAIFFRHPGDHQNRGTAVDCHALLRRCALPAYQKPDRRADSGNCRERRRGGVKSLSALFAPAGGRRFFRHFSAFTPSLSGGRTGITRPWHRF